MLALKGLASALGVTKSTVKEWHARGVLPSRMHNKHQRLYLCHRAPMLLPNAWVVSSVGAIRTEFASDHPNEVQ